MTVINILLLISIVGVSFFLTKGMIVLGQRQALLAIPNERSSHHSPTPTCGGLAILLAYLIFCVWYGFYLGHGDSKLFRFTALAVGVGFLGYVDDRIQLAARWRLPLHFLAAIILVVGIKKLPEIAVLGWVLEWKSVALIVYVLGLVWLVNLFNFMDGIDGIAAVEAITVSIGAAFILWMNGQLDYVVWLIALALSVAGFTLLNWAPAKIFMGDIGSGFLGFIIGGFLLITASGEGITLWSWVVLLAVFVADATVTLVVRGLRKEKIYEAHRSHAYQILSRRWHSHAKVSLLVLGINVLYLYPLAFLATLWPDMGLLIAACAYLPILYVVWKIGAGTTND